MAQTDLEDERYPDYESVGREFGIPDFRLYALADGIRHLLFNRARGLGTYPRPPVPTAYQRLLSALDHFLG